MVGMWVEAAAQETVVPLLLLMAFVPVTIAVISVVGVSTLLEFSHLILLLSVLVKVGHL
jgi:hypothetical protein